MELIAKHEHNLAQQRAMLESVRTQLVEVRDTVGALGPLVSQSREPPNCVPFVVQRQMLGGSDVRKL